MPCPFVYQREDRLVKFSLTLHCTAADPCLISLSRLLFCYVLRCFKCYGNIPDAYKATCKPALGKSDHKVVHLLPRYRARLKREKTVKKEIVTWTEDCKEEMRCELETTDWLFLNSCDTPHELIDTFTSYV